jgi:hypothetical protein
VPDLLALHRNNDPFFCGSPAQERDAEWFTALIARYSFAVAFHLRRVHYRVVSEREPVAMPNGEPYENTEKCWNFLCKAGTAARTLGLVDSRLFVDRRNPDPRIYRADPYGLDPWHSFDRFDGFDLFGIDAALQAPAFDLPEPAIYGYDYTGDEQPFLLEVWIEKTTQNDILLPICERYGMNLVGASGFQSITAAINLIARTKATGKPARVFYISDFDPAGDRMPVAVARQVEYNLQRFGPADVALTPLALTGEQVATYDLPRIPIKESDLRRGKFEAKHGEGAVELDALEALHPGTLADLVQQAAQQYFDPDLPALARATEREANEAAGLAWRDETTKERAALDRIRTEAAAILDRYRDRLHALAAALDLDLEPLREQADTIAADVRDKLHTFDPSLPERAQSDLEPPDESAWLFDSSRDYFDQLRAYRGEVKQ